MAIIEDGAVVWTKGYGQGVLACLGEGAVDFEAMMRTIISYGFDGYVSIEHPDHFGQDDVRPHLPGQATRILASALITDPDAIERAAEAAERHYDELMSQPGGVGEVGLFSSPG